MLLGRGQELGDGKPKSLEQALVVNAPTPTIEPASPKFLAISKHLARKAELLPLCQKLGDSKRLGDGEPSVWSKRLARRSKWLAPLPTT